MSFILDALRKSETERQQQGSAEFSGVPTGTRNAAMPKWLWLVGLLLAINLAVLAGLLLRSTPQPSAATQDARPTEKPLRQPADEPSFEDRVAVAQENRPQRQTQESIQDARGAAIAPVVITQDPAAIESIRLVPSMHEVRASGTMTLPELHLDIHVYSDAPKDRFVFVNMSKQREGSQLSEGPVIEEITPDGVILNYQGQSFLLSRK